MAGEGKNLVPQSKRTHVELRLRFDGKAPLLLHAGTLIDPLHPLTREMAAITKKKASTRTVADIERMNRIEWEAGLHWSSAVGAFVHALQIKRLLRDAGGRWKLGEAIKRGVHFPGRAIALEHDGPQDRDALYDAGFSCLLPVKNSGQGGRVMRMRPCFERWAVETDVHLDPHEVGVEDFAKVVERAQLFGLGDYRPEFGLFTAKLWRKGK